MTLPRLRAASIAVATALGCAPPSPGPDGPPVVVVTIFPAADLVARVAGDVADVRTLLPPRAAPSTWEATAGQIRAVSGAAGYVTVGGGLDGWLDRPGELGADPLQLRLTEGIELRRAAHGHGDEGSGDPHVWLDPILVRDALVPRIRDFLVALDPRREAALRARADALADSLTALDTQIRETLSGASNHSFIATHAAWAYFSARYGLTPLGSLYERPGHEPSARGLARLVDAARAEGLRVVLAEPQLAETAARALASELGAVVITVDPLGGPGLEGRGDYLSLMRYNASAFARALEGH